MLLEQRDTVRAREAGEEARSRASPRTSAEPVLLVRVPLSWQVKGLLASGETVGLLVLGVAIGGVLAAGLSARRVRDRAGDDSVARRSPSCGKLVGWWDWRVAVVPTGMQVRHGMFSLTTRTFNVERLQGVRITETPAPAAVRPGPAGALGGRRDEGQRVRRRGQRDRPAGRARVTSCGGSPPT